MNKEINIERVLTTSRRLNMLYIENIASKKLSENKFKEQMIKDFEYLHKNYEAIFNISISKNYDFNRLKFMLEMAQKVKKSEITEHDASVQVGQVLVDQIVKPQLDKAGVKPDKK